MPVRVEWDDEARTAIRYTYEGRWSWDEFDAAVAQAVALLDGVDHEVHIIIDVRRGGSFPGSGLLSRARPLITRPHSNVGLCVVVGLSSAMAPFWQALRQVYSRLDGRYKLADSLDEARAILAAHGRPRDRTDPEDGR